MRARNPVKQETRRGRRVWVVDDTFVRADGAEERYRKASPVQTKVGASARHRQLVEWFQAYGTIAGFDEAKKSKKKAAPTAPAKNKEPVWEDGVAWWRTVATHTHNTMEGYEYLLAGRHFERWARVPLKTITKKAYVQWSGELAKVMADGTRRNHLSLLRAVLGACEDELIDELPRFPALPVSDTEVEAHTPRDVRVLMADPLVSDDLRMAIALAAYCGLRTGEIRALRFRDLDLDAWMLTIRAALGRDSVEGKPKGKARRRSGGRKSPVTSPTLRKLIQERIKAVGLRVLDSETGEQTIVAPPKVYLCGRSPYQPFKDKDLWELFSAACERNGVDNTKVHSLRHYFATELDRNKTPIKDAQKLLGHSSIATTALYIDTDRERITESARAAFGDK